jgi:outer membrane protein assembly factor BamB
MHRTFRFPAFLFGLILATAAARAGDWPEWRGPTRDGVSQEKGLPEKWGLAWKAPYGGRSAPVVLGNHVYLQNSVGKGAELQERVVCLDADSGKALWEHRFNVYLSDVPPHRVGWASPSADPQTGNVYAFGVGGVLLGLSPEGKQIWRRSLGEDFGLITTHGGRTVSPLVDGDLVIVSGLNSGWGEQARGGQRFFAFDKRTGETVWVSQPGGRPYDTTYSPPVIGLVGGVRLLIQGGGDGAVHALKPQTGEPVWRYEISKRGINTGAVINGNTVIVSHGEENLDTSVMGLLAAIDGTAKGVVGKEDVKWRVPGFVGGYSSPVLHGDRIYQIDNGANLFSFDVVSGRQLWKQNLGTIQKASPVLADGKLYVGTENGKFFILRPRGDRCEVLESKLLGTEAAPEAIIGSPAVSRGRIFVVSSDAVYAVGTKSGDAAPASAAPPEKGSGPPAHVQVVPTELTLKPGDTVRFRARLFDAQGRFLSETQAAWSLERLGGTVGTGGEYKAAAAPQAGLVKATAGGITGAARVRVIPPLPWSIDFESLSPGPPPPHWINASGKYALREIEGNKVLAKLADNAFTKRARAFLGPSNWSDYTVEADIRATEKRRQMGDAGVVAQRYALVLFGNHQRLELQSWQPETERTVLISFPWKAETWYRLKLRVENLAGGKTRVQGKAWPAAEAEPAAWTVERVDAIPNREGSPGLYADAPFEVFFDNLKVTANR